MSEIGREESGGRVRVARTNYLHEKEGEKRIGEGQKGVVYQQRVFLAWSLLSGRLRRTADRLEGWPGQTPVHQLPRQSPSRDKESPPCARWTFFHCGTRFVDSVENGLLFATTTIF